MSGISTRAAFKAVLISFLPVIAAAQQNSSSTEVTGCGRSAISFAAGSFTAQVRDCMVQDIASQIEAKTGVTIALSEGIADDRVTAETRNETLDSGLRHLFGSYDLFIYYGGATKENAASVRSVWIYPAGKAKHLKPVPPADWWANDKDVRATLNDPDVAVRAQAYEALMSHPNPAKRNLVYEALRDGGEDRDDLRERILSSAVSKGFPLSPDLLADLAQNDHSEQVRWLALDALSNDEESAKRVAEQLQNDPSQAIRERAEEILAARRPEQGAPRETQENEETDQR